MLRLSPTRWTRPPTLDAALAALGEPGAQALAGGTDLLVAMKNRTAQPSCLVSLADACPAGVVADDGGWTLGAATTLWDLERWDAPAPAAAIPEAARLVAAPPIRSRATVGGNLCLDTRCVFYNQSAFWRSGRPACRKAGGKVCHAVPGGDRCHAVFSADLPPALAAVDARARVAGPDGERRVPVIELYTGRGLAPLALAAAEVVASVEVPPLPGGSGSAFEKVRARRGLDFAAASAAVWVEAGEDGACRDARVVLGAVASGPVRAAEAEAALRGSRMEPEALAAAADAARRAARPVKNADFTPAYRRKVVGVAVKRAAARAWQRAVGAREASS